jgi:hypothetical protein
MESLEEHVLKYCAELRSISWFSNLGGGFRVPETMVGKILLVSTLADASIHVISDSTNKFLTRSSNALIQEADKFDLLSMTSKQLWKVQREYEGYLDKYLDPVKAEIDYSRFDEVLAAKFRDQTEWIIIGACFARRYLATASAARFYDGMISILSQGNCIAGWEGQYPEGALVVY